MIIVKLKGFLLFLLAALLLYSENATATHNRAGEITYVKLSTYTYSVKIVTYTKTSSPADRPELEFWWGDGSRDTIPRLSIDFNVGPDIQRNIYVRTHVYPGTGSYIMYFLDENRNANVINIPGSVNIPFYVQTQLIISPAFLTNSSPQLLHPKPLIEVQDELSLLLETILLVKEKHQSEHVVNVLIGKVDQQVKNYKHDKLEVFAEGVDRGDRFWTALVRQAILAGLLTKDIDNYGLLKLSDDGHKYLKNPTPFKISLDANFEDTETDEDDEFSGGAGGGAADEHLFELLKTLRKNVAKQKNLPPFVVFQDPSLEEMATNYPISIDELKNITGVGAGKAAKYGKPFIDMIKKYVEENEIERPMDLVVKSVVNKSGLKVYIIQNIDRKISLEDMADAKGMKMKDIIGEIESIVASGTRIDIQYYINEVIDEERQDEVFDYFKTAENDSIESAINELGENEYTEEEVRLMRIKFMSEVGN